MFYLPPMLLILELDLIQRYLPGKHPGLPADRGAKADRMGPWNGGDRLIRAALERLVPVGSAGKPWSLSCTGLILWRDTAGILIHLNTFTR